MIFVGIDVSKEYVDVAFRPSGEIVRKPNTDEGIGAVVERLIASGVALVVVEATGGLRSASGQPLRYVRDVIVRVGSPPRARCPRLSPKSWKQTLKDFDAAQSAPSPVS